MNFPVTAFYAAVFALMIAVLSNIVSAKRGKTNIAILHGDNMDLALWIRRHGNLVEAIPLVLILMGLAEARGLSTSWLHAGGAVLIVARLLHVAGFSATNAKAPLRIMGGVGTQAVMLALAGYLLWSLA